MIYYLLSSLFSSADSLKMLALERVRGKFFTRAWGEFTRCCFSMDPSRDAFFWKMLIKILRRFYQGSWINSGSNIDPVDGISQRCFADIGQGRLLHLLGLDSHLSCADVLHRLSEERHETLGWKWVSRLKFNIDWSCRNVVRNRLRNSTFVSQSLISF